VGFTQQWSLTSTVDARTQGSGGHSRAEAQEGEMGELLSLLILQYMDADKKNVGLSPTQQNIALA
jgi:hypothetical protein